MNLTSTPEMLIEVVVRTAAVYAVLMIGLRVFGKREIGQMAPTDLVLLLLISNAVQNAMVGSDSSLAGGLVSAGVLLVLNFILSTIASRSSRIRKVIEGEAAILIRNGAVIESNLRKEKLTISEVEQALREHGVSTIAEVSLAVLEIDGTISVLKNDEVPAPGLPHHRIKFVRRG